MSNLFSMGKDARPAPPPCARHFREKRTGGRPVSAWVSVGLALMCCAVVPLHAAKAQKKKEPREGQASAGKAAGASGNASDFEAFRLIVDRNIFNPNRTGRSPESEQTSSLLSHFSSQ